MLVLNGLKRYNEFMNNELFERLRDWRNTKAQNEGIPVFRILQNKTIEDIIKIMPQNKKELLEIKGIKDKKFAKYGKDILNLIKGNNIINSSSLEVNQDHKDKKPYTVSNYLDLINSKLRDYDAKVQGEISSLNISGNYLFFSLKDKDDGSLLNCFMWASDYKMSGIEFEEGLEIIAQGFPDVYKPSGKLSLRTSTAELVGEGALKKAYEKLKKRLEDEGLFDLERKKNIPDFVHKIGLITSETGAVINDFLNNLGKYGYQIDFFDSRVEGQVAVKDLISAINYFKDKNIDVLVIIRGGGSLESLQAFNNETLVRRIADFNIPVICGIGHDKDIPLSSLVSDLMVSTPTAVTVTLNKSWEEALNNIRIFEKDIIYRYQELLINKKHYLEMMTQKLWQKADSIFNKIKDIGHRLMNRLTKLEYRFNEINKKLKESLNLIINSFKKQIDKTNEYLAIAKKQLKTVDPRQQLKLGYSIASINGKVIKSIKQVNKDDKFNIKVFDGKIKSKVEEVINK